MFSIKSFGKKVPKNWQDICRFLNFTIWYYMENEAGPDETEEACSQELWEEYWEGRIFCAPKPIY